MNLLWAPGQSDAAGEISRHLNRREKAAIYALSFLFGLCCFAIPMVFMGSFMALGPFQELIEGIAFPVILCLVVGAWSLIALQRRLLLGTQVAKDNGYNPGPYKCEASLVPP